MPTKFNLRPKCEMLRVDSTFNYKIKGLGLQYSGDPNNGYLNSRIIHQISTI